MSENRWILPEGIEELLPEQAWQMESLRQRLLQLHRQWGYQLVMPPMIEYLESLLTGSGSELRLQTFQLVDQMNGRMLGVRADMTPQVARIDAHSIAGDGVNRLCYSGTALRTHPDQMGGSRSPLQFGAELFGHNGIQSDCEIMSLMIESLQHTDFKSLCIDIGHSGVLRAAIKATSLDSMQSKTLFSLLQRKALDELRAFVDGLTLPVSQKSALLALNGLQGDAEILETAKQQLQPLGESVQSSVAEVELAIQHLHDHHPDVDIHIDLAELRGYSYHTGLIFSAYDRISGKALARGGRYNGIGAQFGRERAATGYSADLRVLVMLLREREQQSLDPNGIWVEQVLAQSASGEIKRLRQQGETVVVGLSGADNTMARSQCSRQLLDDNGVWRLDEM